MASVSEELWIEEGAVSSKGILMARLWGDKQWPMVGKEECYRLVSFFTTEMKCLHSASDNQMS